MNTHQEAVKGEPAKAKHLNPWLGIWLNTRETLLYAWQHLLEEYIHRHFIVLGVLFMLAIRLPEWSVTDPHPIGVLVQILLFGPMGGIAAGYVFSALVRTTGGWMGKHVPSPHTKCMVAWSDLPFMLFWVVFLVCFVLVNRTLPTPKPGHLWLFQSFAGWLPVLVSAPFYVFAVIVRIRSIMVMLGLKASKAALVWLVSTVISYVPAGGMTYVFLILYFVTSTSGAGG